MSLIADLPEPKEAAEIRLSFKPGVEFKTLGPAVIEDLKKVAENRTHLSLAPNNYEGVRMNFDKDHGDGWALVRMSLHDPIMPINVESETGGGNAVIIRELYELLKGYKFLNLENLEI